MRVGEDEADTLFWRPLFFHFTIFSMPEDQSWVTVLWAPMEPWQYPRLCLSISPSINLMSLVHTIACEICFHRENDYPVFECRDCLFPFLWMFVQSKEAACYEDLWYHNKDVLGSNTNNIFDAFCSKSLVKLKFIYRRIFLTHSVQF